MQRHGSAGKWRRCSGRLLQEGRPCGASSFTAGQVPVTAFGCMIEAGILIVLHISVRAAAVATGSEQKHAVL